MEDFWKALLRGLSGEEEPKDFRVFDWLLFVIVTSLAGLLIYSGM